MIEVGPGIKALMDWLQVGTVVLGSAFIVARGIAYISRLHGRYEDTERRVNGHAETLDEHSDRLGWLEGRAGKDD